MANEMSFKYTGHEITIREGAESKTERYRVVRDGCDSCVVVTDSGGNTTIRVHGDGLTVGFGNGAYTLRRRSVR